MHGDCQHPRCGNDASETYHDEHDNTLSLCDRHYYRLVSGESVVTSAAPRARGTGAADLSIAGGDVMGSARRETSTQSVGEASPSQIIDETHRIG